MPQFVPTARYRLRASIVVSSVLLLAAITIITTRALTSTTLEIHSPSSVFQQTPPNVVISQMYGGGGNTSATYKNDYIELFNRGNAIVNMNGWTVQYAAAAGNSWQVTTLYGSLAPGHYFLVKEGQGAGGTQELPSADAVGSIQMNATAGKVALINGAGCLNPVDPNGFDCEWDGAQILDLVGYGSQATTYEGDGPTIGPSNTTAILRGANGCVDLNNNRSDFDTAAPNPRNTLSAPNTCSTATPSTSILISEFRTRGPNGGNDEFIELYNKSDAAVNIGGWKIKGSSNTGSVSTRLTIAANTSLPAHRHFLATNTASLGYSGTRPGDQTYTVGIVDNGGIALSKADDTIVDQVGMSTGSAFKEGRVLESFTINSDRSYERKPGGVSGSAQDTDDNRSDFFIRTPPDPQNLGNNPAPQTALKIVHIDVGQGDATLIIGPSKSLLFDAGPTGAGTQIRAALNSNNLSYLDYFVGGHYDDDHIGGIDEVVNSGIPINLASYDRGGNYSSAAFTQYLNAVGLKRSTIGVGDQIDLGGGCLITCIAVDGHTNHGTVTPTGEDDRSIALVLRFGTFDYYIASDLTGGSSATADVESFIARDAGDVDILHAGSHGGAASTNPTLLNTLHPEQAVISLGDGNSFGYPAQDVLDRFSAASNVNAIWQTELGTGGTSTKVRIGGNITCVSDGMSYSVSTSLDPQTYTYSTDGIAGSALPGPQAVHGGPYSGTVASPILFNGGGSTDAAGTITTYQWTFGDRTTGVGSSLNHVYNIAGTYSVRLIITDSNGAKASADTTATVVPPNQPPVANAGGPYSAQSGTAIQFSGNGSNDPDGTISTYEWNFGDGNTGTGATPTHVYAVPGSYSATLTVTDNSGATASAAATVMISNRPPQANAGGPYSGPVGASIQFQGSGIDPDGSISTYEWDFGDGGHGSGALPTHSYLSSNIYAVTLTVTDNLGATFSTTTSANINTAPIANVGGPYSGLNGSAVQLNGSASYDSDGSISSYQWNFGDGTTGSGEAPLHVYSTPGSYIVTLTVADNLGVVTTSSGTAIITSPSNQLPIANPGGPYSAVRGTPIQFNGAGSSDADGTITQYQWNFADGTGSGPTPSHTFAASGTHLVTLTVTDDAGATNAKSVSVNVSASIPKGEDDLESSDVSWNPSNRDSLDDPLNRRGNASNTATGNNNFQIVAPVLSLPGRGQGLALNLIFNSLLWNKSGSEILFDIDHDWPAPGWNLGFGKMVMMGTAGAMIIEPDGTRHPFTGKVFNYSYPPYGGFTHGVTVLAFKGHTTDGSNIEYRAEGNVGLARYPNGTIVRYWHYTGSAYETYLYPGDITDANGNVTSISYVSNCNPLPDPSTEPRIQRIVDTVGRVISFHYDSQQRLTSITGPGLPDTNGNPTTQTFVRIHYKTQSLSLTGAFSGLTPRAKSTTFSAIDSIYYPATGKGYWLGGDSYSSYGMITKVTEERAMTFSPGADTNEQGSISEGTVTRQQVYNDYPSSPAGLTGAPSFTHLTESWDGGPTNSPVTIFNLTDNPSANERTMTITNPDGSRSIQKSFNFSSASNTDPNKYLDGLMKEQQVIDSAGHSISKSILTWEKGPDDAPRLLRTENIDEVGQVLATKYDAYGPDNSIGRIRDYDYDGTTVTRTTRNTFISYSDSDLDLGISSQYQRYPLFHPRRINLIDSTKIFEGDDSASKLIAYSEFKYDQYAEPLKSYIPDYLNTDDLFACGAPRQPGGISGILNHAAAFNPMPFNSQNGGGYGSDYITRRGNVTSVISFADTLNSSAPSNPITETRTFDMAGNIVAASRTCCEQTSFVFQLSTQYGFVVSETRGAADPNSLARVTTSTQYDLNTGLPLSRTDANGRPTTINYFPGSLRPKEIISSTGAVTSFEYDDIAAKVTQTARLAANGTIANQTTKYLNGLTQVIREEALGANNTIDIVETVYDQFGRLSKQSLPYRSGETPQWKQTIYDSAGRVSELREPAVGDTDPSPVARSYRPGEKLERKEPSYDLANRMSELRQPTLQESSLPPNTKTLSTPRRLNHAARNRVSTTTSVALDGTGDTKVYPVTKYFYNETTRPAGASSDPGQTTKTVDPWGRWRWMRLDSNGRIAEVVEPNPAGGTGLVTRYFYNALGKLARVEQGDQIRRFRYDSLGRLTQEKLAEASATLNSAGEKVTQAEMWSDVFTYDQRSNLTSHTDARGVKTIFSYQDSTGHDDPLNRLQSVSYDTSRVDNSLTVLPAPSVSYQYRGKSSPASLIDVTEVKQVLASGVNIQDFDYDSEGRLQERRLTLFGRSQPMTTTYGYDNLGRISQITYPEQYQSNGTALRKAVTTNYDVAGRMNNLQVNGVDYASQINYNANSQITSLAVGAGANQLNESYSYNPGSSLLETQTVQRGGTTLMSLRYEYRNFYCEGSGLCIDSPASNVYTGQVTRVTNVLTGKMQHFSYDSLGRLKKGDQGVWDYPQGGPFILEFFTDWDETYSYDRYGNRTGVAASNTSGGSPVPQDGFQNLSYDTTTNRITTAGFTYDPAGNQLTNGSDQSFVYDAAGRLAQVKDQNGATAVTYTYGDSNHRLITQAGNESSPNKTYYIWEGDSVIAEYTDPSGEAMPQWAKNYIYLGTRLLATEQPNSGSGEIVHYHHPDRLGTKLITNNVDTTYVEQENLPFGTALGTDSGSVTNRRFTSYDRSATSGLDYAVNRHYDSRQGRFTQPDPLGMGAASLADPQSLNMYSYVGNDPVNRVDPDGQFWGALFQLIAGLFHNLKPNIINGSFAYHNNPPVSVSFTTNFQNVGVSYGVFGVPLRVGGQWLPQLLAQQLTPSLPRDNKTAIDWAWADLKLFIAGAWGNVRKSCQTNVLDKLATLGFTREAFHNYLNRGADFYDGERSQLTMSAAFSQYQINIPNMPVTVSDLFARFPGSNAWTSGNFSSSKLTIFFRASSIGTSGDSNYLRALLFHESLHGYGSFLTGGSVGAYNSVFGAYGDQGLLTLFGLNTSGPTSQITQYIQSNCF